MIAFAANSLLNRAALAEQAIGPGTFATIRIASGVVVLLLLLTLRDRRLPKLAAPHWGAVGGLSAYMLGFSFAYVSLDAGVGALILFGGVQVTMFAGGLAGGERPPGVRWLGMAMSMCGLLLLCWPSDAGVMPVGAILLMSGAALGWGIYSLRGRTVTDPLFATAWNFTYALPVAVVAIVLSGAEIVTMPGVVLAVVSGAVTSGLGYALWYAVLPQLGATAGALSQLSVPVIAMIMGMLLLGEDISAKGIIASTLVLGGIGVGILGPRVKALKG